MAIFGSSFWLYLSYLGIIQRIGKKLVGWYAQATSPESPGGEKIIPLEWTQFAGMIAESIFEERGEKVEVTIKPLI